MRRMEMITRAERYGYKRGKHQEKDRQTGIKTFKPQTEKQHKGVLDVYITYIRFSFKLDIANWS